MKQKLQDFILLLQRDRKVQFVLALLVIFFAYSFIAADRSPKAAKAKIEGKKEAGQGGKSELIDDVMVAVQQDLRNIRTQSQETATKLEELSKNQTGFEAKTAEIFKRILEQMAENEAKRAAVAPQPGTPGFDNAKGNTVEITEPYPGVSDVNLDSKEPLELDTIGFEDKAIVPPAPPAKEKIAFVGAGDSVRLKLLAGVRAPTDGTPYPVVFKLIGDVYGPDGSALPLGEARLIAAAQGSLVDSRVLYRLSSLNIRLPSGRNDVIPVDGWVVGEDGIRGMEGVLIDPFGKAIGATGIAGGLSAFGSAAASNQVTSQTNVYGGTTSIVTGDDMTYAAGKAISGAANAYSDLIKERLRLLVPHVEVLSNREATAVFSKSFTIKGLFEEIDSDEEDGMVGMN